MPYVSSPPVVLVSRRGAERLQSGHPWVYRSDIVSTEAQPGDLVRVQTERGRPLGLAMWSSESQIALRAIGATKMPDERAWFVERIRAALALRAELAIDATAW